MQSENIFDLMHRCPLDVLEFLDMNDDDASLASLMDELVECTLSSVVMVWLHGLQFTVLGLGQNPKPFLK